MPLLCAKLPKIVCLYAPDQVDQRRSSEWQIAVLIFVAILRGRKSKSSQWRFLQEHTQALLSDLGPTLELEQLPSRATYMRRYQYAHRVYELAIEIGGRLALMHHVSDARVVAVDKSMIAARGRPGHRHLKEPRPKSVDIDAGWGKSAHDGWVWGYSYEVVVCAGKNERILPLLASASKAGTNEHRSFAPKIARLPRSTRYILGDAGYDGNDFAEAIEYDARGKPTHRHFITPMIARGGKPAVGQTKAKGRRERRRQHRMLRARFLDSVKGRRLYKRRLCSVEPFNQWLKERFALEHRVWHRGMNNNRTMLLAAIFIYQSLQRYSAAQGHRDGAVQWILDAL